MTAKRYSEEGQLAACSTLRRLKEKDTASSASGSRCGAPVRVSSEPPPGTLEAHSGYRNSTHTGCRTKPRTPSRQPTVVVAKHRDFGVPEELGSTLNGASEATPGLKKVIRCSTAVTSKALKIPHFLRVKFGASTHLFRRDRALDQRDDGIHDGRSAASRGVRKCAPPAVVRCGHQASFLEVGAPG